MAGANIQVVVDGRWLTLECLYGDVEMSTSWPGGSDELSWSLGTQPPRQFRGNEKVTAVFGGVPVWAGQLVEPDPSQERLVAQGAWRDGENFMALTSGGAAANGVDPSIDNAIGFGLRWTRPASISSSATSIDTSGGPVTIRALLDTWAENNTKRWGVNPRREVYAKADDTAPTYQMWPLDGGLGYALDNYASTLFGRYIDSTTGTAKTTPPVTDTVAQFNHGTVQKPVDLTSRGPISAATATGILTGLLKLGRATPAWTANIVASYGELLTMGGVPVSLETVAAGAVVRVHGGFELAMRQNGAMYVDVPIGQTSLAGGILTMQPAQYAVRNLTDAIALAVAKSK